MKGLNAASKSQLMKCSCAGEYAKDTAGTARSNGLARFIKPVHVNANGHSGLSRSDVAAAPSEFASQADDDADIADICNAETDMHTYDRPFYTGFNDKTHMPSRQHNLKQCSVQKKRPRQTLLQAFLTPATHVKKQK